MLSYLLRITSAAALAVALAGQAAAQVGHDPARSPYRDLRWGQFLSVSAGQAFGKGGSYGLGPHDGPSIWARHEFLADRALTIGLGAGYAQLQRNYADTSLSGQGFRGPVDQNVWFAEGLVQLNLTGNKTWNSVAPYIGLGLGLAFGENVPEDRSGYRFGTKFYFAPAVGMRTFLTRRLYVRAEARAIFVNLSYPALYRTYDPDGLGPMEPLLANQPLKQWAPTPVLHAGLGYAFRNPFF